MTGPLAPLFAQLEQAVEDAFRIELDECCTGPKYEASLKQQRDERLAGLSVIERHVQDMEPTYPMTPVDCLISELRDMFFYPGSTRRIPPVLLLPRFEERIAQFNAEVAALPASGTRNRVAREKEEE